MSATLTTTSDAKIERIPLAARLAKIGNDIGYIQKGGYNDNQKYKFVQESEVVARLRPALADAGIMVVPTHELISVLPFTTSKGSQQFLTTIKSTFTFTDGVEFLAVTTIGQGADAGDKGIYKAMTGSKKYALLQAFLLATGDDPEIAREDEQPASKPEPKVKKLEGKPESTDPKGVSNDKTGKLTDTQRKHIFALGAEIGLDKKALGDVRLQQTGKHSSAQMTAEDGEKLIASLQGTADMLKAAVAASGGELVPA